MHLIASSKPKNRRIRLAGLAAITSLALLLAACGGGDGDPDPSAGPSTSDPSQSASETPSPTPAVEPTTLTDLDQLEVSADLAVAPEVVAPYPFKVNETMSKLVVTGDGPVVPSQTASVEVHYLGINARSGETFDASWNDGDPVIFPLENLIPGFGKGVNGVPVGSRVAIAITSGDGYDPAGNPTIGIEPGDTLLFVVDILEAQLAGPVGEPVDQPAGLPVVTEADGVPVITIPDGLAEPQVVQVQPVIQGAGRALGEGDVITSHSVCVTWAGLEYHNDYDGSPVNDAAAGGVHQALFNALVGQQTGSRVLVTMPGSVGYPNGNPTPSIAPNTAVACVVDVLFTQPYA